MENNKRIYPPYCIEDRRFANTLWNEWCDGLKQYCQDNAWDYSFDNELSGKEAEATPLSKLVWIRILNHNGILVADSERNKHTNTYYLEVKNSYHIHFDIMNNPKLRYPDSKELYEKKPDIWKRWADLYHTIGNFAPVLWIENENFQKIHLFCNERWDIFLNYLRDNWNSWIIEKDSFPTFSEYLKLSVMWVYIEGKLEQFKSEVQGDTSLADVPDEKWVEFYDKSIFDNEEYTFIDFADLEKRKQIPELIEYRGRCIIALCRKWNCEYDEEH